MVNWGYSKSKEQAYPKTPKKNKLNNVKASTKPTGKPLKSKHIQSPKLEEILDGSESVYKVKGVKAYPEIEGVVVPSNIYVHTLHMPEFVGDDWKHKDKPFLAELMLVPDIKKLHPIVLDELAREANMSTDEFKKSEYSAYDIISSGRGIRLGNDQIGSDEKKLMKEVAKNAVPTASLIGFYLDKPWNQIGTNGWDSLRHLVHNAPVFGGKF